MSTPNAKAFLGLLLLFLAMATLLFVPAWTLDWWQAWVFLAVYFASGLAITIDLMRNDPQLLARRMSGGPMAEVEPTQKLIMSLVSLGFLALLLVPALDRRLGWSRVPPYMSLVADAFIVASFLAIRAPRIIAS